MFKLNPGRPAVVETRTVVLQQAEPPTVQVTLGITEALILAALQGAMTGHSAGRTLYTHLRPHPQFGAAYDAVKEAVGFDGGVTNSYQASNISMHAVQDQLDAIKAAAEEVK